MWWRKLDNIFSRFDTVPACDRQTDVQPISITCFNIADAGKKWSYLRLFLSYKHGALWRFWVQHIIPHTPAIGVMPGWIHGIRYSYNVLAILLSLVCVEFVSVYITYIHVYKCTFFVMLACQDHVIRPVDIQALSIQQAHSIRRMLLAPCLLYQHRT